MSRYRIVRNWPMWEIHAFRGIGWVRVASYFTAKGARQALDFITRGLR
jgi:hypothetical protein